MAIVWLVPWCPGDLNPAYGTWSSKQTASCWAIWPLRNRHLCVWRDPKLLTGGTVLSGVTAIRWGKALTCVLLPLLSSLSVDIRRGQNVWQKLNMGVWRKVCFKVWHSKLFCNQVRQWLGSCQLVIKLVLEYHCPQSLRRYLGVHQWKGHSHSILLAKLGSDRVRWLAWEGVLLFHTLLKLGWLICHSIEVCYSETVNEADLEQALWRNCVLSQWSKLMYHLLQNVHQLAGLFYDVYVPSPWRDVRWKNKEKPSASHNVPDMMLERDVANLCHAHVTPITKACVSQFSFFPSVFLNHSSNLSPLLHPDEIWHRWLIIIIPSIVASTPLNSLPLSSPFPTCEQHKNLCNKR